MHVKLLIGQRAGQIVDLPSHAATNLLMTGQAQRPTEDEIAAATEVNRIAMQPKEAPDADEPGTVIHEVKHGAGEGLKIVAAGGGKFDVLALDGTKLNEKPLARSEASLLAGDPPRTKGKAAANEGVPADEAPAHDKKPKGRAG